MDFDFLPSLRTLFEYISNGNSLPAREIDVFAARTVYVSSIKGLAGGYNLETGLGPDGLAVSKAVALANSAKLNAVLALATESHPVNLFFDTGVATARPVVIPPTGNVTIDGNGWSCGWRLVPGSNCSALQDFPATNLAEFGVWNPGGPTAVVGKHVAIRNVRIHCNRGTYPNGNVDGTPDGTLTGQTLAPDGRGLYTAAYLFSGIILQGIDSPSFENVWVYGAPTFHFNLYHCPNATITRCRAETDDLANADNTDGFHINGGCGGLRISKCFVRARDDSFAINIAEGDGVEADDIVVSDCVIDSVTMGRIYGANGTKTRRVKFRNITGTARWWGLLFGLGSGAADTGVEANESVEMDSVELAIPGVGFVNDSALVKIWGNAGVVTMRNCAIVGPTIAIPMVRVIGPATVSALRMLDCVVHRNATGNAAAYALEASTAGSTIGDLILDGFHGTQQSGQSYADIPALVNLAGTTVGHVTLGGRVRGVGEVLNITAASVVGGISVNDLDHASNAGSPAGYTIVAATTGHSTKVPVSVGRYTPTNLLGVASGDVSLTGPGLVSSGFAIPDAMAANWTDYFSTTLGGRATKDGSGVSYLLGTPPAATAYTVTGPTGGTTNGTSANFTIHLNGLFTGTITVTPGGGGLSTPIVKTYSGSSADQTFTIDPTAVGTVTLTCTNSASLANQAPLSYAAAAGGATTFLDDAFTGTAGATIAGTTPSPTANGTDVWTDFSGTGFGAMGFAPGGGATSLSLGNSNAFAAQALTGAPAVYTAIVTILAPAATGAIAAFQVGRAGAENHEVLLDYNLQQVRYARQSTSSGTTVLATQSFTLTPGTQYVVTAVLGASTITISINGTPVFTGQAITPTGGTQFLIYQSSGNVGDIVFKRAKVTN